MMHKRYIGKHLPNLPSRAESADRARRALGLATPGTPHASFKLGQAAAAFTAERVYRRTPKTRNSRVLSVRFFPTADCRLCCGERSHGLPGRFNCVDMKASAAERLGKVPAQPAQFDRRIPVLVTHVDQLSLPHTHLRRDRAHLELLRDRALMHLLLSSGMTKSEVISLDRTQIDDASDDSTVIVGRGHVFWAAETRERLDAWLVERRDDYLRLFIRLDNNRSAPGRHGERWPLSAQSVWRVLTEYGRLLGIDARPQGFRHVMACTMLENDAPIPLVQELLGHTSATVTTPGLCGLRSGPTTSGGYSYNR